ncbi:phosphoesterase family-domain-containing protein [Umbelopsis sp. AD052]|nr:phosphoesterase family-domain-containing protein [Umbelopsis sp. AD052]
MRSLSVICFSALAAAASVFAQDANATTTTGSSATTSASTTDSSSSSSSSSSDSTIATATSTSSAATASGSSTGSSTQGKVFQRILQIWLENTDYETASTLPDYQALAAQGILLNNTYAITHPSEPNYVAATGGSNFGIDNDDFYNIPANVSTIFDLLENKGLQWKAYQEDLPSVGYTGFKAHNGSYVRKHNPAIIYDSIGLNATRAANVVPATQLATDIAAGNVPHWTFYTPNMTNDAHDTTAEFAGKWLTNFFNTTLSNKTFVDETLILVTFDENDTYPKANRVWSLLLGAIPAASKNTTDGTFYTHYSSLSTVEQNWDLGNLGRGDANKTLANVYSFVASQIGYTNVAIANGSSVSYFNETIPGLLTNQSYNETHPSSSASGSASASATGSTSGANGFTTSAVAVTIASAVVAALML